MNKFYIGDIIKLNVNNTYYITRIDSTCYYFYDTSYLHFENEHCFKLATSIFRRWETMKLIFYPNKDLETKCEPVLEFDADIGMLLDRMKEVMLESKGIGLAANQIGVTKKIIVIKTDNQIVEMINPLILDTDGEVKMKEGCLSFPGIHLNIFRPEQITVQYQDRTGEVKKVVATGLIARTILHECEHLSGVTFLSKVSRNERKLIQKKLGKNEKA